MKIGSEIFERGTYVMAIINLTPDSFFAPSRKNEGDILSAVERAQEEGAAIIDIGAQSTRPGYVEVSADEEIARFSRPLKLIKQNFDIPVSVDTYFSKSARAALDLGADMINDIWGLSRDRDMARTVAEYGAAVCIMHNSPTPVIDLWGEEEEFLKGQIALALESGVSADKIVVDGGIGFAKTKEQNFELLEGYERLLKLGYPTLLGCSRKSMFGGRAEDRLKPTLEATRLACEKGALFVRVHDVAQNAEVIRRYYSSL